MNDTVQEGHSETFKMIGNSTASSSLLTLLMATVWIVMFFLPFALCELLGYFSKDRTND